MSAESATAHSGQQHAPVAQPPPRIRLQQAAPELYQAYQGLEVALHRSGFDPALYELVKTRASQINGCAFCLDMHTKDARAAGETEQRLYLLPAWREAPLYTERERAALALTEAVTLVADGHVDDGVWAQAAAVFPEPELAALLMAIVTINGWNRIAITLRSEVGGYQPARSTSDQAPDGTGDQARDRG